jgi:hypothetical protein
VTIRCPFPSSIRNPTTTPSRFLGKLPPSELPTTRAYVKSGKNPPTPYKHLGVVRRDDDDLVGVVLRVNRESVERIEAGKPPQRIFSALFMSAGLNTAEMFLAATAWLSLRMVSRSSTAGFRPAQNQPDTIGWS